MTFLPECGGISLDRSFFYSSSGLIMFHVCQICWNEKYKDFEQV